MLSRLQWLLLHLSRQMWLRATAFSLLGIVSALVALLVKGYIPSDLPTKIGANAVGSLLNIIATSMLSVTIFSLSTMVSAFASATSNVTPRATSLLTEDSTAQNALATFIGSFLFSLVGIIGLNTGLYGESGRVVLYAVTLLVVVLIVFTLLRWIDYVLRLGRVAPTSARVEEAATKAMRMRHKLPYLGGIPIADPGAEAPPDAHPVHSKKFGYVEHIDMAALQEIAEEADLDVFVMALPGELTGPARPLARLRSGDFDVIAGKVREAFSVADRRSFDQDPRFGLCVLSEIASRAMSPSLNDPGTAIDILGRGARVLAQWASPYSDDLEVDGTIHFSRVHVPPLDIDSMFDDFFAAIARDGAANVEVAIQLQKMLQMLASLGQPRYRQAAERQSEQALARNEAALTLPRDIERAKKAASYVCQGVA